MVVQQSSTMAICHHLCLSASIYKTNGNNQTGSSLLHQKLLRKVDCSVAVMKATGMGRNHGGSQRHGERANRDKQNPNGGIDFRTGECLAATGDPWYPRSKSIPPLELR